MFFRKSDSRKKNDAKLSLRRADVLITGVILGGIVASVYGVKKAREKAGAESETPTEETAIAEPPKKPNFFLRLYHAIRYGQDYDGDSRD